MKRLPLKLFNSTSHCSSWNSVTGKSNKMYYENFKNRLIHLLKKLRPFYKQLYAIVDDEQFERLKGHTWYVDEYGRNRYDVWTEKESKKIDLASVVAEKPYYKTDYWCGTGNPSCSVRHIDKNYLNCCKSNLRIESSWPMSFFTPFDYDKYFPTSSLPTGNTLGLAS
jgi:hypothetical protein